jgi:diketogulonate reductase-like aldo/keto reductase
MILEENYKLYNAIEIPKLGLGTWFIKEEHAAQAVKSAIEIGYRHIDTAQAYRNEKYQKVKVTISIEEIRELRV